MIILLHYQSGSCALHLHTFLYSIAHFSVNQMDTFLVYHLYTSYYIILRTICFFLIVFLTLSKPFLQKNYFSFSFLHIRTCVSKLIYEHEHCRMCTVEQLFKMLVKGFSPIICRRILSRLTSPSFRRKPGVNSNIVFNYCPNNFALMGRA